jgi:hypothetical protein
VRAVRASLDAADLANAQRRADRRILPVAHDAIAVGSALRGRFEGELEHPTYEMLDEEILEAVLVPSNYGEFLSEIADRSMREAVVRELMLDEVLPFFHRGPAYTGLGLSIQWTLGCFVPPAVAP